LSEHCSGSDLKKSSRSPDRDKENQEYSYGVKTELQDKFWYYFEATAQYSIHLSPVIIQKVWFEMSL